jgi:hypothetical protein
MYVVISCMLPSTIVNSPLRQNGLTFDHAKCLMMFIYTLEDLLSEEDSRDGFLDGIGQDISSFNTNITKHYIRYKTLDTLFIALTHTFVTH